MDYAAIGKNIRRYRQMQGSGGDCEDTELLAAAYV